MAWAWVLALVVVAGVGLPVAGWLITRRAPPPRTAGRLGAGSDTIDRWLLDQYQLPRAAARVSGKRSSKGSRSARRRWRTPRPGLPPGCLPEGSRYNRALGILALVGSGLYLFVGVERALRAPRRIRRNAARALQLNQDGT
jgi:hypothetical protein